jgi:hypothetical protein
MARTKGDPPYSMTFEMWENLLVAIKERWFVAKDWQKVESMGWMQANCFSNGCKVEIKIEPGGSTYNNGET